MKRSSFPLRSDLEIRHLGERRGFLLVDPTTAQEFELGSGTGKVAQSLGGTDEEVLVRVEQALGKKLEMDKIEEFAETLASFGLLDDGSSASEHAERQREARADHRTQQRLRTLRSALRVMATVPLYKQRFAAAGFDPTKIEGAEQLAALPLMEKDDLRKNFPDKLLPEGIDLKSLLQSGGMIVATSGTTDERLQVVAYPRKAGMLREDALKFFGVEVESLKTAAVLTTPICAGTTCHLGESTMQERTRGVMLTLNSSSDVMRISDEEVENIVSEMHGFEPSVLFVHPWYAVWVGLRAQALGLRLYQPTLMRSSYQFLTLRHRRLLQEIFGAPAFSYYAATEMGGYPIADECREGRLHVMEDDTLLELSPLEERPDLGEVLVTTMRNHVMPLLRYRVGDVARWEDAECPCDFGPEWRCITLEGRRKDMLRGCDGALITTREIDEAIGADDVDFYRFIQKGVSSYVLEAIMAEGADTNAVKGRLEALVDGGDVSVREVDYIGPERSLKFRQSFVES